MYFRIVGHRAWQQLPYGNQDLVYFKTFLSTGLCDKPSLNKYNCNVISKPIQENICFISLNDATEIEI